MVAKALDFAKQKEKEKDGLPRHFQWLAMTEEK
jgi:hypothetical protein